MPVDLLGRPLRALRVSVTDRCNLRCQYCMPEAEYAWLPRPTLLSFEEIATLVEVFTGLGVDKVRLTGGEPLLRRNLPELVRQLAANSRLTDLALTTNGVLLSDHVEALRASGLSRVTISLDTLRADRFTALTRMSSHPQVVEAARHAARVFGSLKIDAVMMRGVNDDEMADLVEFGRSIGAEVRFIEYMDVGGATQWSHEKVVSREEMLDHLRRRYGTVQPIEETAWAPADRFRLSDGTVVGIIASTTTPFCRTCDRARLTADGMWFTCLYAKNGIDLRGPLRAGASAEELAARLKAAWSAREDRGAEIRAAERERHALLAPADLKKQPHLEMHTRGG